MELALSKKSEERRGVGLRITFQEQNNEESKERRDQVKRGLKTHVSWAEKTLRSSWFRRLTPR